MAEKEQTGANCNLKNTNKLIANKVGKRREEEEGKSHIGDNNVIFKEFKNALDYHEGDLKISGEVGDGAGEGTAYSNPGKAYHSF